MTTSVYTHDPTKRFTSTQSLAGRIQNQTGVAFKEIHDVLELPEIASLDFSQISRFFHGRDKHYILDMITFAQANPARFANKVQGQNQNVNGNDNGHPNHTKGIRDNIEMSVLSVTSEPDVQTEDEDDPHGFNLGDDEPLALLDHQDKLDWYQSADEKPAPPNVVSSTEPTSEAEAEEKSPGPLGRLSRLLRREPRDENNVQTTAHTDQDEDERRFGLSSLRRQPKEQDQEDVERGPSLRERFNTWLKKRQETDPNKETERERKKTEREQRKANQKAEREARKVERQTKIEHGKIPANRITQTITLTKEWTVNNRRWFGVAVGVTFVLWVVFSIWPEAWAAVTRDLTGNGDVLSLTPSGAIPPAWLELLPFVYLPLAVFLIADTVRRIRAFKGKPESKGFNWADPLVLLATLLPWFITDLTGMDSQFWLLGLYLGSTSFAMWLTWNGGVDFSVLSAHCVVNFGMLLLFGYNSPFGIALGIPANTPLQHFGTVWNNMIDRVDGTPILPNLIFYGWGLAAVLLSAYELWRTSHNKANKLARETLYVILAILFTTPIVSQILARAIVIGEEPIQFLFLTITHVPMLYFTIGTSWLWVILFSTIDARLPWSEISKKGYWATWNVFGKWVVPYNALIFVLSFDLLLYVAFNL